ncbi:MAG: hypothetical protein HZC42_05180 [Candidatus Eisenbacteria bacterium]|nr:hypothetical protein [Candidatus Eisenbacteria bacterium]
MTTTIACAGSACAARAMAAIETIRAMQPVGFMSVSLDSGAARRGSRRLVRCAAYYTCPERVNGRSGRAQQGFARA